MKEDEGEVEEGYLKSLGRSGGKKSVVEEDLLFNIKSRPERRDVVDLCSGRGGGGPIMLIGVEPG